MFRAALFLAAGLLGTSIVWPTGSAQEQEPTTQVKLVHAIFRHGPRTPADTYPNDPYIDFSFAPSGWGQLTNIGKLAQYNQGKFLRQRYDELLGEIYSPNVIVAQTTDVDRTKMSAQLELAGMWPPAPSQRWNPDLNWQPIPVHSQPLDQDNLLLVRVPCARYHMELEQVMQSAAVQGRLQELNAKELYAELTNITGLSIRSPDDVQSLYSTLKAEEEYNLTLPEWTAQYYPSRLEPITALSFEFNVYTRDLQKIKGGPLLKKIIRDSQGKIEGTLQPAERKFYMYAGHDSTISNLLMALRVWDTQIPSYGILILVELHQETESGQYGMKVYLRNSTAHEPYPLTLPGCSHFCPFSTFLNLTMDVIPDDLETLCHVDDPNYVAPTASPP